MPWLPRNPHAEGKRPPFQEMALRAVRSVRNPSALSVNRPRGLAMIGGGAVGALLAGLSFLIVNQLTGGNTSVGTLLLPSLLRFC